MGEAGTIDVHTHYFPQGLRDFAALTGDRRWPSLAVDNEPPTGPVPLTGRIMRGSSLFRPVRASCFDLSTRVTEMDATGIAVQVLSPVPITLVNWAPPELAAQFAREQNDLFAAHVAQFPGRFRWFASVPLQACDLAIAELARVHALGADGVEISSEVAGVELDDPGLLAFFEAAASLDIALFVHPTDSEGAIRRKGQPHEFGVGMLTDTAMAAGALLFGGVLETVPGLRVGLAHGCGTMPWAFPRLARGATLSTRAAQSQDHFDVAFAKYAELLKHLWADTLVFDPTHIGLLIERFGVDHLLLGSDFPFYPETWGDPCAVLDEASRVGICSAGDAEAIRSHNAHCFLGPGGGPRAAKASGNDTCP